MKALDIDDKMLQPRAALVAHQPGQEPDGNAGGDARHRLEPARPADQPDLRGLPAHARTTPARSTSTTCCSRPSSWSRPASGSASCYARKFQLRAGRRVPGHEPAAVHADPPAGRASTATSASSATPTSRSTGGAARTCATSSTSSTTFPDAHDRQARAELPLDAGDSRRGLGGHQPEPQPQGQAALDRPAGRRARSLYVRAGDEIEEADFITRAHPRGRSGRTATRMIGRAVPHQRAVARDRRRADARGRRRTGSSAASGSTSARKSRTRSPTCACSSTRTTT